MNEYRIRATSDIKSRLEITNMNPNTPLPAVLDSGWCDALGIDPVLKAPKPETTQLEAVLRDGAVLDDLGNWVQAWEVQPKFSDYTDENSVVITRAEQEAAFVISETAKAKASKEKTIASAIQDVMDKQAQDLGYDSIHTGVTYAEEPAVPKFQAEGIALRVWRSQCWATAYTLQAEFEAGTRPEMTPEEVVALLPVYAG